MCEGHMVQIDKYNGSVLLQCFTCGWATVLPADVVQEELKAYVHIKCGNTGEEEIQ